MGVGGQRHAPAALPPGKGQYPLNRRWVWTGAENLAPPRFDPRTVQLVASHYTDWAIPTPRTVKYDVKNISWDIQIEFDNWIKVATANILYVSHTVYQIKVGKMGGTFSQHLNETVTQIFVLEPERKQPET
jgi:hypothetical protein